MSRDNKLTGETNPISLSEEERKSLRDRLTGQERKAFLKIIPGEPETITTEALVGGTAQFLALYRYPVEKQNFVMMTTNPAVAYYRDAALAATTRISNAVDGDVYTTRFISDTPADLFTEAQVTFRSSLPDGRQNCFVYSDGFVQCGTNSVSVLWITPSQCVKGPVRVKFFKSTPGTSPVEYSPQTPPIEIRQRIEKGYVPFYDQADTRWGGLDYGRPPIDRKKIHNKGCAMSALAQLLSYHLMVAGKPPINPGELNEILAKHNGYTMADDVAWCIIPKIAKEQLGLEGLTYITNTPFRETDICSRGPQLFGLTAPNLMHWVTVHGKDGPPSVDPRDNYLTNDPYDRNGEDRYLVNYVTNKLKIQTRVYEGQGGGFVVGRTRIGFHSPGEIILTDPQGRRTGQDPLSGQTYNEIPFSSYEITGYDTHADDGTTSVEPGDMSKVVEVADPIPGEYTVTVTGTGAGSYDLDIRLLDASYNSSIKEMAGLPISPGAVYKFKYAYVPPLVDNSEPQLVGGFDGGGQRPRDVNKLLTYANPTESQTTLQAGTTTFPLVVIYDGNVIPATFKADLNGTDVTALFNPVPGSIQMVNLNLKGGSNVLKLSIDGNLPNRIATDSDRLVFKVP